MDSYQLKYPIGEFSEPEEFNSRILNQAIETIKAFPSQLREETQHLSDEQLNTTYREGGWTIRQVVNHCADSHMNSLTRFKWTLTEDNPTIKAYYEDRWAELPDTTSTPIEPSLKILEGIHFRWGVLLGSLSENDREKTFFHPESKEEVSIKKNICVYAWHCEHHLAHVTELKKRKGW